ncbi:hypothetical protein [Clostridium beijerinckii]|uniref:Uncharacterized protein n=1 Tax=Clostridium beijerinckii TaxID=1520 RepID=A0AAE5LQD6_CLOBE|nr:hypothetical protein [Clostridium beijerinckii]NSB14522.1 hypothetical protein [Clostridium beijerinckii]OOM27609.1 hypothetical protein CLOBE_29570 [Clostridium beijerinckii]
MKNRLTIRYLIIFLVSYILVVAVVLPGQQVMSKKFKKDSDMHFTVSCEQATGVPTYIMNKKEDIEVFDKVIKEKYPNASQYEIKLIGNTLENKGIDWQDVNSDILEIYGEIVGVESKDKKSEFGANVVAGLRVFGSSSKEEYDKYRNGQIMVFNVSYIDARAFTGLSLAVLLVSPVFIIIFIYLVIRFLLDIKSVGKLI